MRGVGKLELTPKCRITIELVGMGSSMDGIILESKWLRIVGVGTTRSDEIAPAVKFLWFFISQGLSSVAANFLSNIVPLSLVKPSLLFQASWSFSVDKYTSLYNL
jgi:hypothetical protein